MKIVITGATGPIGSALAELALNSGDEVVALIRKDSQRLNLVNGDKVTVIQCGLDGYKSFTPDFTADAFFHLAWAKTSVGGRDDTDTQLKNVGYALDAVSLAEKMKCKVFVGAGSQAEYGVADKPLSPSLPCNPESGYGIAKYSAGKLTYLKASQLGIRHVWARILSVFGENDAPTTLIASLLNAMLNGEDMDLTPCGQIWDYIYVKDCAKALYLMAKYGKNGKAYPIGSGNPRPLKDYVTAVKKATGSDAKLNFGAKSYYPHQPMTLVADITELSADTGFKCDYGFEDAIEKIVAIRRKGK